MNRSYFLELAARGLRMPIGTDLVLHEHSDAAEIVLDGRRLAQVITDAAARYGTPLATPLMDLRLEKVDLLLRLGVAEEQAETFHFPEAPGEDVMERAVATSSAPFTQRTQAHIESVRYIAAETELMPLGMGIGPFSLMTKLVADPIPALAMAGRGAGADENPEVLLAERCLTLAESAVHRMLSAQIEAGAKAVIICEPAANRVYISPRQLAAGSQVFERFVMQPNLRLKALLESAGVDLIFHNCGELTSGMVEQFGNRLHPVMLSLGSSRKLWEDAASVPRDVVLFGNLPTKNFYSDSVLPVERVEELAADLAARMAATGHPFILGSECDVLHVPDAAETIRRKVNAVFSPGHSRA